MSRPFQVGNITYGDFTFPAPFEARISCEPEYDSTGRFVKYKTYTVSVNTTLTAEDLNLSDGSELSQKMGSLRKCLQTSGLHLVVRGQGFGDCDIQTGDTIGFGPKPTFCRLEPLGGNAAIILVWEAKYTVLDCCDGSAQSRIGEFSYDINYSFDENGLTTRTVSGFWEWLTYRVGDLMADNADFPRDKFLLPLPDFFTRSHQNFRLSADRRYEHFSIVDSELPGDNPFFPGCVRMEARHRIAGSVTKAALWQSSISGSVTVAPGYNRRLALWAIYLLIRSRMNYSASGSTGDSASNRGKSSITLIDRLELEEDIFGRSTSFYVSYILACNLDTVIQAAGFYTDIQKGIDQNPPSSLMGSKAKEYKFGWPEWTKSMAPIWGPRGYYNLSNAGEFAKKDRIISPCALGSPAVDSSYDPPSQITKRDNASKLLTLAPPKETSWTKFELKLNVKGTSKLAKASSTVSSNADGLDKTVDTSGDTDGQIDIGSKAGKRSAFGTIVQKIGTDQFTVTIIVKLARAVYEIEDKDRPDILSINGEEPPQSDWEEITPPSLVSPTQIKVSQVWYKKVYEVAGSLPLQIKMTDNLPPTFPRKTKQYEVVTKGITE